MKNLTALIEQLQAKVQQLTLQFAAFSDKKIYAKFDRTLFSEDFESGQFYFDQIQYTLAQITGLKETEIPQIQFFSEKLLAQCTALSDAINQHNGRKTAPTAKIPSQREKLKHELNQLPPRERLVRYYEALQALNEKINELEDKRNTAHNEQQKAGYQHQIDITLPRRKRCLEAIEVLEEYLSFKEN